MVETVLALMLFNLYLWLLCTVSDTCVLHSLHVPECTLAFPIVRNRVLINFCYLFIWVVPHTPSNSVQQSLNNSECNNVTSGGLSGI